MPSLMGILNVTPDSFFDGGHYYSQNDAIARAQKLIADGADIIDIGGESTRPGAAPITIDEEIRRTVPAISAIAKFGKPISIDSRNAAVMAAACEAGARIINDVSALTHDAMALDIVKQFGAEIILMHMLGTPQTMQTNPTYENVVEQIYAYLAGRIDFCVRAGISAQKIIIDPGIGFGKTADHNTALIKNLTRFKSLGCRILIGVSRKSFIAKLSHDEPPEQRLGGSLAAAMICAQNGADILRVHDVADTRQALILWHKLAPIS